MELYLYFPYMSPLNVLSNADIKNEWSCTSTSPVCFHVAYISDTVVYKKDYTIQPY